MSFTARSPTPAMSAIVAVRRPEARSLVLGQVERRGHDGLALLLHLGAVGLGGDDGSGGQEQERRRSKHGLHGGHSVPQGVQRATLNSVFSSSLPGAMR
jgi:hypothetical protein